MSSRAADTGSAAKPCPHCGEPLDRGLAQHMSLGYCEGYSSPIEETSPPERTLPERYDALPLLDNHDERDHPDDDLDERRRLADELADADVWV